MLDKRTAIGAKTKISEKFDLHIAVNRESLKCQYDVLKRSEYSFNKSLQKITKAGLINE